VNAVQKLRYYCGPFLFLMEVDYDSDQIKIARILEGKKQVKSASRLQIPVTTLSQIECG